MEKRIHNKHLEHLRQWQKKPFEYEFATNEEQHCNNCDHTFKGNYCPYCSQKAGEGYIGWDSVRQSVMDVWGLGSHSLPNTVLQLLIRPGYLISDYISGKRQVSFPPVKMLFIVAVIVVFWIYYLMPYILGDSFNVFGSSDEMINGFNSLVKRHFVWTYFVLALFHVLPTWVLFRYAPRHTRHTLPQGFFIQIFLLVLNLIVSFIVFSPLVVLGYELYLCVSVIILIAYFVFAYRQLFGYGIWGSLWRILFVFMSSSYMISSLVFLLFDINFSAVVPNQQPIEINKYFYAGLSISLSLIILLIGWGINMIATRKTRNK